MALLGVPFVKGSAESGTKIREKKNKIIRCSYIGRNCYYKTTVNTINFEHESKKSETNKNKKNIKHAYKDGVTL